MTDLTDEGGPKRGIVLLCAALVVIGLGWFTWRGPVRAWTTGSNDLALLHSGAMAWLKGTSPYLPEQLDPLYLGAGGRPDYAPGVRGTQEWIYPPSADLLYPPPTFALLWPIGLLSWSGAKLAWILVNALSTAAIAWSLVRIAGWRWSEWRSLLLAALVLIFMPVTTTIAHGQTALPPAALVFLAQAARLSGRGRLCGLLLGVAVCLKPQVGLIFLGYELVKGRWKNALAGAIAAAVVSAVGIGRLMMAGVPWLAQLRENVRLFTTAAAGDPTGANPFRYQMLNLHPLLHEAIADRTVVTALVWALVGGAGLLYLALWRPWKEDRRELVSLSLAGVASLLVVYHRAYDAVLILPALVWCLDGLPGRALSPVSRRSPGWLIGMVAAMLGVFFVPGPSALFVLARDGRIPAALSAHWSWEPLFLMHQVWALLVLGGLMLVRLALLKRAAPKSA